MVNIKKKITLDFLGDEYKDDYLTFNSIPLKDYDDLVKKSEQLKTDNTKSLAFVREVVEGQYVEGLVQGEKIEKDQLQDFPAEVYLQVMAQLTGQTPPKF